MGVLIDPYRRGGDPYWASVVLLVTADGAVGTQPVDLSSFAQPAEVASSGVTIIDTQGVFTGKSFGAFVGAGDYLNFANPGQADMGTEDMTLEFFFKPESGVNAGRTFQYWSDDAAGYVNRMSINSSTQLATSAAYSPTVVGANITVSNIQGAWHHYAVVRSGGTTIYQYFDGARVGTRTVGNTSGIGNQGWYLCGDGSSRFRGYMDQFRVTRGVQRYTGTSYVVPTEPFPVG